MTEIIQKNAKYIRSTIIPFLRDNADKRVSQELIDYYKNFAIHQPEGEDIIVAEVSDSDRIVAVSVASIRKGHHVTYSTTVTDKGLRRQGHGLKALALKLKELGNRKLGVKSLVAEDNTAGMALCAKAGLVKVETVAKLRAAGRFMQAIWTNPPVLED